MSRRFFHGLEQGIKCLTGKHVDFINDADPLPPPKGAMTDRAITSLASLMPRLDAPSSSWTSRSSPRKMASRTFARSFSSSGALIAAAKIRALVVFPTLGAAKDKRGRFFAMQSPCLVWSKPPLADEIFEAAWAVATSKNGVRHKKSF